MSKRPRWGAGRLGLAAAAMFLFGFALVPFYGMICRAAGLQAIETSSAAVAPTAAGERYVTVRFDARVQSDLPWSFEPLQRSALVRVGEWQDAAYRVRNLTSRPLTGQAVPSVVPWEATPYFSKAECFCFRQQALQGGEQRELPLRFVITPDLPAGVDSVTISYAFMALR